jgi:mannose-6-phosphate isomerase-like protein (cupin superfamily)
VSVGYASVGVDEPHVHTQITEIYLIARGESRIRIGGETIQLAAGDMLVVEPGEPHTFLDSTPGYFHFVIHTPGLSGEAARADKHPVPRGRLGL